MSNKALDWAWSVQGLNPVEKLVLVSLADQANKDTWQCNPGLELLRKRTCASLRGIRNAIGVLIGRGLVMRDLREGIGATYTLLTPAVSAAPAPAVSARVTQAASATPTPANGPDPHPPPRQPVPVTPAVSAPEPFLNPESRTTTLSPVGSAPPLRVVAARAAEEPRRVVEVKGSRLPPDWQPSGDMRLFADGLGLDCRATADKFRDHWHSQPGAKGRKLDWTATWRNWCREDERRAQRPTAPRKQSRMDRWREMMAEEDGPTINGRAEAFRPFLVATGD